MPPRAAADPSKAPFLVATQGGDGLTHKQTRSAALVAPSRGVRYGRATEPVAAAARAALLVSGESALLTDLSAARAWDLPLPPRIALADGTPLISVSVQETVARPQRQGVRGRRVLLPEEHITTHLGIRLTTPARTWLDSAQLISLEHLVAMGDVILRRRLATADQLRRAVQWAGGRRGVKNARIALSMLDPAAESPGESRTRCHLLLGGLRAPRCNADIHDRGQWLARGDIVFDDEKVVVEYDGAVHLDERQRRHDAARRNLLTAAGWLVIVVTANDLRHPWTLVEMVRTALDERRPRTER